ncbi:MAG: DUF4962 domain-containing protein [Armatimonadota bacterium]|jgi:hypothetical protein
MEGFLLAALVIGTFSGVDITNLMDTPILGGEPVIEYVGEELAEHGEGFTLDEHDGQAAILTTERDFHLTFERELEPGSYSLVVEASAPNRGSDSYWIVVDGEQISQPITPTVDAMTERAGGFRVDEAGRHTFGIVLREAPGSIIRSVRLRRNTVDPPREPMLPEMAAQHPRMLFTADDIPAMRERLQDERVREFYQPAGVLTRTPPPFRPGERNGGAFRQLPAYALSHVLEPSPEKLAALIGWLEVATTYPDCGVDLDAEYFAEGVALTYDWLYHELPEDLRARVRDTLCRQASVVYEASLAGHSGGGLSFQQNHYWFAHLALILSASAVYGEVPEAHDWLGWGWDRAERTFLSFSPDGSFHEGPAYWDFSMPTLYMLVSLYEQLSGVGVPWADTGLQGQAVFRFHHVFPDMQHSAALEDTSFPKGLPPRHLLLWEAKRYSDSVAQGIADLLNPGPSTSAFNFLYLDETLEPADPSETVPLAQYYRDVEMGFARTSWDEDATYAVLISRPLGGHLYAELCDRYSIGGTGHNHPAQGHFVLYGRGEVLAHDPGYTYEKRTRNHNTILVDGEGQFGDGEMWPSPKPGRATITGFVSDGDVTIIAADPSSAYPGELGLTRFDRTFVLAGPDLAVVHDRLEADEPRTFSWLLHHIGEAEQMGEGWRIVRNDAQLGLVPLEPASPISEGTRYLPQYVHPTRDLTPGEDAEIGMIELKTEPVAEATFLVPLLVGDAGDELPDVERIGDEGFDGVRTGETVVAINRGTGPMTVPAPWGESVQTDARAVVLTVRDGRRVVVELPTNSIAAGAGAR